MLLQLRLRNPRILFVNIVHLINRPNRVEAVSCCVVLFVISVWFVLLYADPFSFFCLSFCPLALCILSIDLRGLIQIKNK